MIVLRELLVLLAVAGAGAAILPHAWPARRRVAAAVPVGLALVSTVELVLLATGLPIAYPVVALLVTVVLAATVAVRTRSLHSTDARWAVMLAGTIVVVVAITAAVPIVNVTPDSFRYATVAGLLTMGGSTAGGSGFLFLSRVLALGTVHGLADPALGYLRAVGPIVAISTVVLVGDMVRAGVQSLHPSVVRLVEVGAVLALATNHWYLFNALYLNGHVLFAAWLLLIVMVTLDVVRDPDGEHRLALCVTSVLAVALTVLRPEGALVAVLALAPVVLERAVPRRWRGTLLAVTGIGVVLWHAAVLLPLFGDGTRSLLLGMSALGVALLSAPVLLPVADRFRGRRPLVWLHAALWGAVLLGAVRAPGITRSTAIAMIRNVTSDGLWGVSFWMLAGLIVAVLWTRQVPEQRVWVFPLATFLPLSLVLGFVRGGGYRIGSGDSLNRMLVHVLPLAVVTVGLAAGSRAVERRRGTSLVDGDEAEVAVGA
jgi:hypothetical protein